MLSKRGRPRTIPGSSDPALVSLAQLLEHLTGEAGLTLQAVSERAGMSHAYYGMVVRAQRRPSLDALNAIIRALKVSRDDASLLRALLAAAEVSDPTTKAFLLARAARMERGGNS